MREAKQGRGVAVFIVLSIFFLILLLPLTLSETFLDGSFLVINNTNKATFDIRDTVNHIKHIYTEYDNIVARKAENRQVATTINLKDSFWKDKVDYTTEYYNRGEGFRFSADVLGVDATNLFRLIDDNNTICFDTTEARRVKELNDGDWTESGVTNASGCIEDDTLGEAYELGLPLGAIASVPVTYTWTVTKSGIDENLDVTVTQVNRTSIRVCQGYVDRSKLILDYANADRNIYAAPVRKVRGNESFNLSVSQLDLTRENCFDVHHGEPVFGREISFKIGEESIVIDGLPAGLTTFANAADNFCVTPDGIYHVTYRGAGYDLHYSNSSNQGKSWTGTNKIISGTSTHANVLCLSNNTVIIADNADMWYSGNYSDFSNIRTTTYANGGCALDSQDNYHCCGVSGGNLYYYNTTLPPAATYIVSDGGDADFCDVEVGDNDMVYIISNEANTDDLGITLMNGGSGTYYTIDDALGAVGAGYNPSIAIRDGIVVIAGQKSGDLYVWNSTEDHITDWTTTQVDATYGDYPTIKISEAGQIYILYMQSDAATSDLLMKNATCPTCTYSSTTINAIGGGWAGIAMSNFPTESNKLEDKLLFVYTEADNDLVFENLSIQSTLDLSSPTFNNFTHNATSQTFITTDVAFGAKLTDDKALDWYIFAHNQTGTLTNGTPVDISGTSYTANETITVTLLPNSTVCGQFWFNDTASKINQTPLACFGVKDYTTKLTMDHPPNQTEYKDFHLPIYNITLNATIEDFDGNLNTYLYVSNDTTFTDNNIVFHEQGGLTSLALSYNLTAIPYPLDNATDGLGMVAWYHFDNRSEYGESNTAIHDFSGSLNGGTINGAEINYSGKFGGALDLSGVNEYVNISHAESNNLNLKNWTITAWVWSNFTSASTFETIVAKGATGADEWIFYVSDENLRFYGDGGQYSVKDTADFPLYRWVFITARWNGTELELWKDMVSIGTDGATNRPLDTTKKLTIGAAQEGTERYWQGKIDELAIWNTSLSLEELKDLYKLKNDTYYWKVNATDGRANNNSGIREFYVGDLQIAPDVVLLNPANGTNFSATDLNVSVNLSASVTDDRDLTADILDVRFWVANDSTQLGANNTLTYFNKQFSGGQIDYNLTAIPYPYDNQEDGSGMVLWYHLDNRSIYGENNTNVTDLTQYNNDGYFVNTEGDEIVWGKFGYAFNATEDLEYIQTADTPSLINANKTFSVALWVKPENAGVDAFSLIVGKTDADEAWNEGWGIYHTGSNAIRFFVQLYTTNFAEATLNEDGNWHHIVATYDGTNILLYSDGALGGTTDTYSGSVTPSSLGVRIGGGSGGYGFEGVIDEVAIWNRTLSAAEVMDLYRLKNDTYYWRVNASDGTDYTSSGTRHFTINPAAEPPPTDSYPNVTLNFPATGYQNVSYPTTLILSCNATDDIELANISLFFNGKINETIDVYGNKSFVANFTKVINIGDYNWSCQSYDNATQLNASAPNRTLEIGGCGNVYNDTTLGRDIGIDSGYCLTFQNPDILLDLGGYSIDGYLSGNAIQINGKDNSTIRNGFIKQSVVGIYEQYGNDNLTVSSVNFSDAGTALSLTSTVNPYIANNTFDSASSYAISILGGLGGIIEYNNFSNNVYDVFLDGGTFYSWVTRNNFTTSIINSVDLNSGAYCNITNNWFTTVTGNAIDIHSGSTNNYISDNIFTNSGAESIMSFAQIIIYNNTFQDDNLHSIHLDTETDYSNVTGNTFTSCSDGGSNACLYIDGANNTILKNNNVSGSSSNCVQFVNSSHNQFIDGFIGSTTCSSADIEFGENSINNTFLNATYSGTETIDATAELIRKWYYSANVTNTTSQPITTAYVAIYNVSLNNVTNLTVGADGLTVQTELIEYVNFGGTTTYWNNYTINASAALYNWTYKIMNLTIDQNVIRDLFVLSKVTPAIPNMNITLFDYYGLNSSKERVDRFNSSNLEEIEYLELNFTVQSTTAIGISDWYFNFTANGSSACSLGNQQSSVCYNVTNPVATRWIKFKNGSNTTTYDGTTGGAAQGDKITPVVVKNADDTEWNISIRIDEHYNPNVFKHYPYNFSNLKWQDAANQRISKTKYIKVNFSMANIPLTADQYKLDMRVNYTTGLALPTEALQAWICNSSYVSGEPSVLPECVLVSQKLPSEFQDDGTKFRGVFTKNLITNLGDVGYVILTTNENNPSKYYYIKSYYDLREDGTNWDFSITSGATWSNLGDGYESEMNINWFYDGINPTAFIYNLVANLTNGSTQNLVGNITWAIDPAQNYPPFVDIIQPQTDYNVSGTYIINWTTLDPNGDNWTTNITAVNDTITDIAVQLSKNFSSYSWDSTLLGDGYYNITVKSCENETAALLCGNDTHFNILVDNTGPTVNLLYPTTWLNISSNAIDFNASAYDPIKANLTYFWVVNGSVNSTSLNTNSTFNASDGHYNLTLFVSDWLNNGSATVFFSLDTTAPEIINLGNYSTTNESSGINWSTNEVSNYSLLWYNATWELVGAIYNDTFSIGHYPQLGDNLTNSSTYYINVSACDTAGNCFTNNTFNFTTAASPEPSVDDLSPPIIANLTNASTTNVSSYVTFNSNESVNYTIRLYNLTDQVAIIYNNTFKFIHNPFFGSLNNGTTYFVNVTVWDAAGNSQTNNTFNFTTMPYIPSVVGINISINCTTIHRETEWAEINCTANQTTDTWQFAVRSNSSDEIYVVFDGRNESNGYILKKFVGLIEGQNYYVEVNASTASGSKSTVYTTLTTKLGGEKNMASLAVTVFILLLTGVLFVLPFKVNFVKGEFADFIIKRCVWLFGLFLLSLNTAIVVTIADNASLGISRELFRYLWIVNWTIYLFMVYLMLSTLFKGLKLWQKISKRRRMYGDDNESADQDDY